MNILQGLDAPVQFCVTLNNAEGIDASRVIRTIDYAHPVFTPEAVAAQGRHGEINGVCRTYFCGAYWRYGFHEDGVVSALDALRHFEERRAHEQRDFRRVG
jgi:predicted NAD/FAD-binding protein